MFVFYKGIATIVLIFFVSNIVLCLFIYLVIKVSEELINNN